MKGVLLVVVMLAGTRLFGQEPTVSQEPKATPTPDHYVSTDIVYDAEYIPTIGYEKFVSKNNKLRSWRFDLSYQIHYSDQFGIVFSHGDKVSIGVYQGPVARVGRNIYSRRHRQNWMNYFTYGLALKYLWYNDEKVNTGKRLDAAYRIQSEHCMATVPHFAIGAKRTNKHFCADFYCGLQVPIKVRDRTVTQEQNSHGTVNLNVPYALNNVTFTIAPMVGIKLGMIR